MDFFLFTRRPLIHVFISLLQSDNLEQHEHLVTRNDFVAIHIFHSYRIKNEQDKV